MTDAYNSLLDLYKENSILDTIGSVLTWDVETSKMPPAGLEHRSEQKRLISRYQEKFWRSDQLKKLLKEINQDDLDSEVAKRNVELIERTWKTRTKLPETLKPDLMAQGNTTNQIWKKAKSKQDFSIVLPELEKLFTLQKEYANKLAEIKDIDDPYDALIDERDEGLRSDKLQSFFSEAKDFLIPFIEEKADKFDDISTTPKSINLSREEQVKMSYAIADLFQYDATSDEATGSIDEVEHPLTIVCGPNDVRITVKYGNYLQMLSATNHELGHGLHNLHKNPNWKYQPVNTMGSPSLGECTSRYTENKIGKCYEYYYHMLPLFNEVTDGEFGITNLDEMYQYITRIEPGTSRMRADEVTYGLHIIIRFEIEQMLFDDKIEVSELPQVWNEKYEEYLGVSVPNDTVGVMQDLHWFSYYWGYFHGYFMGDLMGTQLHHAMEKEIGDWKAHLLDGDLSPVLDWHKENVYRKGALYPPLELVKEVTGEPLNVDYFKQYIINKYEDI